GIKRLFYVSGRFFAENMPFARFMGTFSSPRIVNTIVSKYPMQSPGRQPLQKPSLIAFALPALFTVAALTLSGCGDASSESEPKVTTIGPVVTEDTPDATPDEGAAPALQLVADYEGTKPYPLDVCI